MKLISACLLGIRCAWDGKDNYQSDKAIELLNSETLIPVCPEQHGVTTALLKRNGIKVVSEEDL